jgi:hypothetical protein
VSKAWYEALDVPKLWQALQSAKAEEATTRQQVQAWKLAGEALHEHYDQLRRHRDELVKRWPPESNAAAGVYLGHLDRLLRAVDATAVSAETNSRELDRVTNEIDKAHKALKPIHDDYCAKVKESIEFDRSKAKTVVTAAGVILGGLTHSNPSATVAAGTALFIGNIKREQEELNQKARTLMKPLTRAAEDANRAITPPPVYDPPETRGITSLQELSAGTSGRGGAIPVPPIAPPAYHAAGPDGLPVVAQTPGMGAPELAGFTPGTTPPAGPPGPSPVPTPPVGGPGGGGGLPPLGGGPALPPGRVIGASPGGAPGTIGARPQTGIASGQGRTIGGTPGTPGGVGRTGGVIGQRGASPAGGAGAGGRGGMAPGTVGGRRSGSDQRKPGERVWDRDNPWAVARGVNPVIEPPAEPDFDDPGPGVIGIDR